MGMRGGEGNRHYRLLETGDKKKTGKWQLKKSLSTTPESKQTSTVGKQSLLNDQHQSFLAELVFLGKL